MGERANSMCAIWVELIEYQLDSSDPDMEKVRDHLASIKANCGLLSQQPGEVPEHLEEHLFEEGSTETGTVVVDGQEMPRSAAEKMSDGN